MSIHSKALRWKNEKIIDAVTARKIIEFEQARFDKNIEIILDMLGFPVLLISFFLFFIDLSYTFSKEMTYVFDFITMAVFVFGLFFSILRKFKIHQHMVFPTAALFSVIWTLLALVMLLDSRLNIVEIMFVWSAVVIFTILIGKKDYMTLIAANAGYFGIAYLLDSTNPRMINLNEHHWIILSIALVSPLYFVGSGLLRFSKKLYPYLSEFAHSHLAAWIKNLLKNSRNIIKEFIEWIGAWRLIIISIFTGILIACLLRDRDAFLNQILWSNEKLYIICFTGFFILLLSLLTKENSNFSVFFSIFGWLEILARLFQTTPHGLKFTLLHFHYEPGVLAIVTIGILILKSFAKKFTSNDLSSQEITLLGPVGTLTTILLISFR